MLVMLITQHGRLASAVFSQSSAWRRNDPLPRRADTRGKRVLLRLDEPDDNKLGSCDGMTDTVVAMES